MSYALKIKRDDVLKNVGSCSPKELAFDSTKPSAKIIQTDRYNLTIADSTTTEYTIPLSATVAFPLALFVFLYDTSDSSYKVLGSDMIPDHTQNYRGMFSFTSSNLYVTVDNYTGSSVTSHIIYFIIYA